MRVDIRARKTLKEENFHKDGVALAHPQLHAFKLRGDEEFRLAVYQRGVNLTEKPHMVLKGHVEIGGSVNMLQYLDGTALVYYTAASFTTNSLGSLITLRRSNQMREEPLKCFCVWPLMM